MNGIMDPTTAVKWAEAFAVTGTLFFVLAIFYLLMIMFGVKPHGRED